LINNKDGEIDSANLHGTCELEQHLEEIGGSVVK